MIVSREHRWVCKTFADLSLDELYRILALRQEVFIVEQRCPYPDADGRDARARHLFCLQGTALFAYARLFAPGAQHEEASIGRVVTSPAARGTGLGQELMRRAIAELGPVPVRIGAQKYLERFYASFGFLRAGGDYVEDGILHLPMLRRPGIDPP